LSEKLRNIIGKNCKNQGAIENAVLGNNVSIGKKSTVKSSIIFDNAVIDDIVSLDHCVIGERSMIKTSSTLTYSVVGDNEIVPKESNYKNAPIWTQCIPNGYPNKQIGNVINE
jgi:ADP-glucose pyrophosphorylase